MILRKRCNKKPYNRNNYTNKKSPSNCLRKRKRKRKRKNSFKVNKKLKL